MAVKYINLRIIERLKRAYKCQTNFELAKVLNLSPQHLTRINNKRSEVPHWMILLDRALYRSPDEKSD